MEESYGAKAVGLSFNPSGDPAVQSVKEKFADLINCMDGLREITPNDEVMRMAEIAITEMQAAQMWAVKALTWKD